MTNDPSVQTGNEVTESVTSGTDSTPSHDPFCTRSEVPYDPWRPCYCDVIAKVRADEAPKAVARWIEQGASSDDWMKVWQVRDYAEDLEAKVRADERQRIIGVMERNADGDAQKVIDAVLDMTCLDVERGES